MTIKMVLDARDQKSIAMELEPGGFDRILVYIGSTELISIPFHELRSFVDTVDTYLRSSRK